MDLEKVLAELRKERDALDQAIISLERLARAGRPAPGRPPGIAAKSPTSSANGNHRSAGQAPGGGE